LVNIYDLYNSKIKEYEKDLFSDNDELDEEKLKN
jgi:hypothetical protein